MKRRKLNEGTNVDGKNEAGIALRQITYENEKIRCNHCRRGRYGNLHGKRLCVEGT
jgi:hypothetical protein